MFYDWENCTLTIHKNVGERIGVSLDILINSFYIIENDYKLSKFLIL